MDLHVRPTRKHPEYAQRILNKSAMKHWKARDSRIIRPAEVIALLDAIVDGGSMVMANRTTALLGQMFGGKITDNNALMVARIGQQVPSGTHDP